MSEHNIALSTGSILKVFAVLVALGVALLIRDVIMSLLVAIILAAALAPAVQFLEAWRVPRWLSILLVYALAVGLVSLAILLVVPPLVDETVQLTNDFPTYYQHLREAALRYQQLPELGELTQIITRVASTVGSEFQTLAGSIFGTLSSIVGGFFDFVVVLALAYYLLAEPAGLERFIRFLVPKAHEERALRILLHGQSRVASWLRGQLLLSFIVGLSVYVGLLVLGVRSALVLALIAAITELVPIVGPILGAIPAILLALTHSPLQAVLVFVLYLVIQQLENNLLVPRIMRRMTGLDPVVTILAVLVGGKIGGIVGIITAIPIMVILSVLYGEFVGDRESETSIPNG